MEPALAKNLRPKTVVNLPKNSELQNLGKLALVTIIARDQNFIRAHYEINHAEG